MKYETIICPFCNNGQAHITYEENRVYQLNCPDCHNAIFHQDVSWDASVAFFKRLTITDDARLAEICAAEKDGRCVVLDKPVNNAYKSEQFGKVEQSLAGLSKSLEEAAREIEKRCQQWQCISVRAETDSDIRKSGAALFAYTECLKLVDSIGQQCAEAEAALSAGKGGSE